MKRYYLAYGSNLNLDEMMIRCESAKVIGKMTLDGMRLVFRGYDCGYAYLTLEEDKNCSVELGIFEINDLDEKYLDMYEGYPELYRKEYLDISINGENTKGLIYLMNDEFDYNMPANSYVYCCLRGFDDFNFDKETINEALQYTWKKMPLRSKAKKLVRNIIGF